MADNSKYLSDKTAGLVTEVCALMTRITGIQFGERQALTIETRLKRRMMSLGIDDPAVYQNYIKTHSDTEIPALVTLVTTHHTYFFREFPHFEFLEQTALPALVEKVRKEGRQKITVWSAACSRGQEVYSLSMCLKRYLDLYAKDIGFEILGSDIDTESVGFAKNGVYRWIDLKEVPMDYLGSNWIRGTGSVTDFVKAGQAIRSQCSFKVVNLHDIAATIGSQKFDIIFCRNVFIYFSMDQIKSIVNSLKKHMEDFGYLFVGISEPLTGMSIGLRTVGQSIYSNEKGSPTVPKAAPSMASSVKMPVALPFAAAEMDRQNSASPVVAQVPATPPPGPKLLRVLCVDDSPTILSLLKQILRPEYGFEVVATAVSGRDASRVLKRVQVDVITSDIHMPEQTGIEFLEEHRGKSIPPVVMVSSVNRENAHLAQRAIELGAYDYIEKPAVSNFRERAEEIRMKLKSAANKRGATQNTALIDLSFKSDENIVDARGTMRVIIGNSHEIRKIILLLKQFVGAQPPTVILMMDKEASEAQLVEKFKSAGGNNIKSISTVNLNSPFSGIYIGDYENYFKKLKASCARLSASILAIGPITRQTLSELVTWPHNQILIEESDVNAKLANERFGRHVPEFVPLSSFSYMSSAFVSKQESK